MLVVGLVVLPAVGGFAGAEFHRTVDQTGAGLQIIGQEAGGGVVEGYPHDTGGQKVSVLYNGTRSLYERAGFSFLRAKGKRNCVMRRVVP